MKSVIRLAEGDKHTKQPVSVSKAGGAIDDVEVMISGLKVVVASSVVVVVTVVVACDVDVSENYTYRQTMHF